MYIVGVNCIAFKFCAQCIQIWKPSTGRVLITLYPWNRLRSQLSFHSFTKHTPYLIHKIHVSSILANLWLTSWLNGLRTHFVIFLFFLFTYKWSQNIPLLVRTRFCTLRFVSYVQLLQVLTGLSVSSVIGQSDCFGFGFNTLNWKLFYNDGLHLLGCVIQH